MLKQFEDKMRKSLDSMANDFMTIRAGRANPHVLDKVKVDYYGVATPEHRLVMFLYLKQERS